MKKDHRPTAPERLPAPLTTPLPGSPLAHDFLVLNARPDLFPDPRLLAMLDRAGERAPLRASSAP